MSIFITIIIVPLLIMALLILFILAKIITSPSMDECGEINECVGCRADDDKCVNCKWNPCYWRYDPNLGFSVRKSKAEIKELKKRHKEKSNEQNDL